MRRIPGTADRVLVGLVSYLGLLPLLRLSASGPKEPLRRNLMMVAAHALWGSTLGSVAALLSRSPEAEAGDVLKG